MTHKQVMNLLHQHNDPAVRAAAVMLEERDARLRSVLNTIKDVVGQLRLEIKTLVFDLECTRQERDEARKERY